jgi:hypothetical protein
MIDLKKTLVSKGIGAKALEQMDEEQIYSLAKAFGVEVGAYAPRDIRIETGKNGAQYVVTDAYPVPKYKNQKPIKDELSLSRNLYVRVEAIDQIIADLTKAKGLLE